MLIALLASLTIPPSIRAGGEGACMRNTYDRRGGNEAADASHLLYQEADDFNVTLDILGTGTLQFARYNRWHGSPWHYEVDGRELIVLESSTVDPDRPVEGSVFIPEAASPSPLTWTWSKAKGAEFPRPIRPFGSEPPDDSFPDQRAAVSVAEGSPGATFREAGTWHLAGSNTCVYSNPREETGKTKTQHVVQTSYRRWRDEEFLLPRELKPRSGSLRVWMEFKPVDRPLFPGGPNPRSAWSEYRSTAHCFVLPLAE